MQRGFARVRPGSLRGAPGRATGNPPEVAPVDRQRLDARLRRSRPPTHGPLPLVRWSPPAVPCGAFGGARGDPAGRRPASPFPRARSSTAPPAPLGLSRARRPAPPPRGPPRGLTMATAAWPVVWPLRRGGGESIQGTAPCPAPSPLPARWSKSPRPRGRSGWPGLASPRGSERWQLRSDAGDWRPPRSACPAPAPPRAPANPAPPPSPWVSGTPGTPAAASTGPTPRPDSAKVPGPGAGWGEPRAAVGGRVRARRPTGEGGGAVGPLPRPLDPFRPGSPAPARTRSHGAPRANSASRVRPGPSACRGPSKARRWPGGPPAESQSRELRQLAARAHPGSLRPAPGPSQPGSTPVVQSAPGVVPSHPDPAVAKRPRRRRRDQGRSEAPAGRARSERLPDRPRHPRAEPLPSPRRLSRWARNGTGPVLGHDSAGCPPGPRPPLPKLPPGGLRPGRTDAASGAGARKGDGRRGQRAHRPGRAQRGEGR